MKRLVLALAIPALGGACGSPEPSGSGAGGNGSATATVGSGTGGGGAGGCAGEPGGHGLAHVILVVQENHTFDSYFGKYCQAAPGSSPTCSNGPSCCEAAPATEPSGASPVVLDDKENSVFDPDHSQACEVAEIDSGKMDKFVTGAGCSNPKNFAVAPPSAVATYTALATSYALADRYFHPIAGASSSNDMYFAVAKEVFIDNQERPKTVGAKCTGGGTQKYTGQTTIASLLQAAGKTFRVYAEGYGKALAAGTGCAPAPDDCALHAAVYPCIYDPSDIPFLYYAQHADDPQFVADYAELANDLASNKLPTVSFVKSLGYRSEHPGGLDTISDGEKFVATLVDAVAKSCYKDNTLILVTWDEGGGFFDHVAPPPTSPVDNQPYGMRVPLVAIGRFAKKGTVSHVPMEHSSIVKFLEFVFLGGKTGQLGARDVAVNDIGSLLDPAETGLTIPDQ